MTATSVTKGLFDLVKIFDILFLHLIDILSRETVLNEQPVEEFQLCFSVVETDEDLFNSRKDKRSQ